MTKVPSASQAYSLFSELFSGELKNSKPEKGLVQTSSDNERRFANWN